LTHTFESGAMNLVLLQLDHTKCWK